MKGKGEREEGVEIVFRVPFDTDGEELIPGSGPLHRRPVRNFPASCDKRHGRTTSNMNENERPTGTLRTL